MKKLQVVMVGLIFALAGMSFAMQADSASTVREDVLEPMQTENPNPPTAVPTQTGSGGGDGGTGNTGTTNTGGTSSSSSAPPPASSAGRIADLGGQGSVYLTGGSLVVYGIGSDSRGYVLMTVTPEEVAKVPEKPERNTLIERSSDGKFAVYRLTTGELQINIGPDSEGTVRVRIFTGLNATSSYGYSFNVYDILGRN